jgi:5,10-methylenetetrahydromethanopterin reductase
VLGFFFWPYGPAYTARMAALGESLGFDLVGVADTPGNAMDMWVALGIAAARTERVRLAACVTNFVSRHPVVTASAAASLAAASNGRFTLGVGTGHSAVVSAGARPSGPTAFRDTLAFSKALLAGERATLGDVTTMLPKPAHRVPLYAAGSGPRALAAAGAVADGVFVNYGLQAEHVAQARAWIGDGSVARSADGGSAGGESLTPPHRWFIACLDVSERREDAYAKLGNILGFVAAYVVGPDPAGRGVPPELVPAVREMRRTYTTRRADMDPALLHRLGLFDYLRRRLAIAGTPDDCIEQIRAARAAGVRNLMFTVSLAADPERTVELFGRHVLPVVSRD